MDFHWIFWASFLFIRSIESNKFNVSYTGLQYNELQFCREYDVKSGYKYSTFFRIDLFKSNGKIPINKDETILDLKLFVLASRDAHILLSPTDQIKSSPIYEIVLGAGGNTFNEIKRQRQKDPLKTVKMRRFLSSTDIMPLSIRVLKSGNITIAITGQSPFIFAFDANVLDVKYLSFSTWGDAEGKWFYDCESDTSGNRLVEIEQKLTDKQRLKKYISRDRGYDSTQAPYDLNAVMISFDLANANFNTKKSYMQSTGRFRANWIDSQLSWNKSEFGGLSMVRYQNVGAFQYVWTPQVRLLNGKDENFISLPLIYTVTVYSNGSIWAESSEPLFSTWCFEADESWPYNSVFCTIQIQLEPFANISLLPLEKSFHINPQHQSSYDYDEGEWHITEVRTTSAIYSDVDNPLVATQEGILESASVLKVQVLLIRNFVFYNHLISFPLIGAFSLILLSFWVERYLRITLNAVSLIVLTVMLLVFADHGPKAYTPTIVCYYLSALFFTWISLLSFTIRCWFKEYKPNIEMLAFVSKSTFAQLLPGSDHFKPYEYADDADDADSSDFSEVIDRLLFFILSMVFLISFAIGY